MENHTLPQKITDTLQENYMPYAMSVIVSRAIPEIDGLKPAHRKLLYTMYKMGLLKGNRTKSANIVGQTMKLNPHGDQTIYETMVRLTKGAESLLAPFVDSKGNFGKHYSRDMSYAAPRYTEAKLDTICHELFQDIEKDTVDFIDNYDGTMKEPTLLPTTFPNILVNPNSGIAVGMANSMCGFNLREVCKVTIEYLKDEQIAISKYLKAPDFPSGGKLIYSEEEMQQIYETGRGSFKIRSKYIYDKKNNCIEINEIPYTTTTEAIMDKLIDLIKSGKIRDITDIRDETDLGGLKLTIDLKRNTDPHELMCKLYKFTPLEDSFSCNFNILVDGHPKVMGVREIIHQWTKFRINCIKRKLTYELDKKSKQMHLLQGLNKILLDIDKAIRIIRETAKDKDVIPNLMKGFTIDELQAEFIAEIKLRNLNKEYILKRTAEINNLEKELKHLNKVLNSEKEIKKIIMTELQEIGKKYGQPRRSEIVYEENVKTISEEDLIEDYNLKIFFTKHNYLKKISLASLRGNSDQDLKEEDEILQEIEATNKAEILLFSNKQNVYKMRIYEIEDCKASDLGEYLPNILEMEDGEEIIYIVIDNEYKGFMLFAFENGKMTKLPLKLYETKTNRKKLVNAYYGNSKCVGIFYFTQDIDLVSIREDGRFLLFNTSLIETKTNRKAAGDPVMKVTKKANVKEVLLPEAVSFKKIEQCRGDKLPAIGKSI